MNGLARYLSVLRGGTPDLLPRTPILMHLAARHIGATYAAFASDQRVLVEANLACARDFGFDQVSCISDPYRETEGFGGVVEYREHAVPLCTAPLAESKEIARLARPNPLVSRRMRDRVEAVRAYRSRVSADYSILGWVEGPAAEAATLRGTQQFMIDLIRDGAFAAELMDVCVDVGIEFALAQIEAGADTIGIGDAIASQVSPKLYDALIQPREKRLVHAVQAAGAYVKLHICGNITHLLPGIADLRVNVLDVDHMVSLRAVRAVVGPRVVLTGNIDPVEGILRGTPESIRTAVARAQAEAGRPYLVNAGCEIPVATPAENVRALCAPLHE